MARTKRTPIMNDETATLHTTPALPPPTPPPIPFAQEVEDAVFNRLSTGNREDFVRILTRWTLAAPGADPQSMAALKALALRYPDRYMQGMTMAARIAGLMGDPDARGGGTTIIAFVQQLQQLSDAEVYRRARENARAIIGGAGSLPVSSVARTPVQLRQPPPGVVIDGEKG